MTVPATPPRRRGDPTADALGTTLRTLHDIVDSAGHLTLVTDEHDRISFVSGGGPHLTGQDRGSLVGRPFVDVVDPADRDRVLDLTQQFREGRDHRAAKLTIGFATVSEGADARLLEADLTMLDRPDLPRQLVWAVRELGYHRLHQTPVDAPMHDALTDLPNEAMLLASLNRALARHHRLGTRVATVVVTVTGFAPAWEERGHRAAGDLLLAVAGRLETMARPGDLVARIGVDEVVLVLDGIDPEEQVHCLIAQARARLGVPVDGNGRPLTIDATVGAAVSTEDSVVATELLDRARAAATTQPAPVGASPTTPGPASTPARQRSLVSELQDAIRDNQIRAAYQPIVDLTTGELCGFEALARWDHPERGAIPPAVFITLAEHSGLIVELGRHLLVTACTQMETWRRAFPQQPVRIGVNASPRQLVGPTLIDDVRRALKFSGLPPEHLVLEITESGLHRDLAGVRRLLAEMRDLGVRTAMDDFGTGYSSLAYLRRLPLDILKIDRSFVADREGAGPRFLAAIVSLGLELGLDTLAEGIEEPDQLETAAAAGCRFGQGYLIARPLEAAAAGRLFEQPEALWTGIGRTERVARLDPVGRVSVS